MLQMPQMIQTWKEVCCTPFKARRQPADSLSSLAWSRSRLEEVAEVRPRAFRSSTGAPRNVFPSAAIFLELLNLVCTKLFLFSVFGLSRH